VVVGFGVTGALVGHLVSLFLAGTIGVAILYRSRLRGFGSVRGFVADVKEMNVYGLPVYAGTVILGLASYFVLILLARIASDAVYGYYQAAANFTVPIALLASAMVSALFPAFASIDGVKADVNTAFRHAYRFVAYLLTPLIVFIIAGAGPLVRLLLGSGYEASVPYLQLLALATLPIAFGYSVHPAFFNGFGRTRLTLVLYLTASITLFLAAPLLAETYGLGVDGLIYATFLSYFVAWAVGTYLAYNYLHAALDIQSTVKILLVSAVSYAAVRILPTTVHSLLTLVIDVVIFSGVYLTLTPLVGAITKSDLDLVELTVSEPAIIEKVASPFLHYERLLVGFRTRGRQ
jgi:O-antigen/teichoic acid export membrane protein